MRSTAVRVLDIRVTWLSLLQVTIVGVLAAWFAFELASGSSDVQHGLLIAAAAMAMKKFGHKSDDADEDAQGEHPVTRFLFQAANAGDYEGIEDVVDDDFQAFANGYAMLAEETDRGPELFVDLFDYWRKAIPDERWELYDEVSDKQQDKSELICVRFVASGTIDGGKHDIEIAAFVRVTDRKMAELRMVTDLTIFNQYRAAIGLPILE